MKVYKGIWNISDYPYLTRTLPVLYPYLTRTLPVPYPYRTRTVPVLYPYRTVPYRIYIYILIIYDLYKLRRTHRRAVVAVVVAVVVAAVVVAVVPQKQKGVIIRTLRALRRGYPTI